MTSDSGDNDADDAMNDSDWRFPEPRDDHSLAHPVNTAPDLSQTNPRRERHLRRMSPEHIRRIHRQHVRRRVAIALAVLVLALAAFIGFFIHSALTVANELEQAITAANAAEGDVAAGNTEQAVNQMEAFSVHVDAAYRQTSGTVWQIAAATPYYGRDVSAVRSTVTYMEHFATDAVPELEQATDGFSLAEVSIRGGVVAVPGLADAVPHLASANVVTQDVANNLRAIENPHVHRLQELLTTADTGFDSFASRLDTTSQAAQLAVSMLDLEGGAPKTYLVLSQSNAELRPSGGLPGSWGIVTADHGKLSVNSFVPESTLPWLEEPIVDLSGDEKQLFTDKLGRIPQDVNFTPDFPRTGQIASAMWQRSRSQHVDGVIAIDPVALQSLLQATGTTAVTSDGTRLDGSTTATTLLHDVYATKTVDQQDAFFSEVAAVAFSSIMQHVDDPQALVKTLGTLIDDGHVLAWSDHEEEQQLLEQSPMGGALATTASKPQIGVFFSDLTQSKMDWYLKREISTTFEKTAQDGSRHYTVHITLTNMMDASQIASTPAYVLGDLPDSISPGQISTTTYLYAPTGGRLVDWTLQGVDGQVDFDGITTHDALTVAVKKIVLSPGESFEITAHVQSAPGVTTPVTVRQTPQIPGRTD